MTTEINYHRLIEIIRRAQERGKVMRSILVAQGRAIAKVEET